MSFEPVVRITFGLNAPPFRPVFIAVAVSFLPIRFEVCAVVHERPCYRPLSGFAGRAAFQRAGEVGEGFPQPSLSCSRMRDHVAMNQRTDRNRRLHWMARACVVSTLCFGPMACAASHCGVHRTGRDRQHAELSGLQARFAQVADRVTPSIVAISAVGTLPTASTALLIRRRRGWPATRRRARSRLADRGHRLRHRSRRLHPDRRARGRDAEQLWITTDDQKVYAAMIVGTDPRGDLAVLKIAASGLQAGEVRQARLGEAWPVGPDPGQSLRAGDRRRTGA